MAKDEGFNPVDDAGFQPAEEKTDTATQKPDEPGVMERFGTGFMDPVYGGAQLGARMTPEGAIPDPAQQTEQKQLQGTVDNTVQDREKSYQERRGPDAGTDWARMAGNVANPLNYVGLMAGGLPGAAISGGMAALLQPVINTDDYAGTKAKEALMGTAFGAGGTVAGKAVGWGISPIVNKVAKELMDKGVQLTPGQMVGGILRRAEEAAKSFPILGSFIRGAEGRSTETFNNSVINQSLDIIGEKLPTATKPGRQAIDYAHLRLNDAYDNLLPQMKFGIDNQFATDMQNVRTLAAELPPSAKTQFEEIIKNRFEARIKNGAMDGRALKNVESDLTSVASDYRHSSVSSERELGMRLDEVRGALREALTRQNPQQAPALQKLNTSFAMFARIEAAAARRATSAGLFTPADLLAAIKAGDKTARKGAFARGDALMQEYAEFGQLVLPGKLPDSGTSERMMWDMLGLGTALVKPEIPIGLGAASLPYTKAGTTAINAAARPGPTRQAIGGAVKEGAPVAAAAGTAAGFSPPSMDEMAQ